MEPESELPFLNSVGGADADIGKSKIIVRAQILNGELLVTQTSESTDFGRSFVPASNLDLSTVPHDGEVPSNASVTIDHTNNFHIPVATKFSWMFSLTMT